MNNEQNSNTAQSQQLNIAGVISRFSFHVHDDIEEAAKWYKIPLALYSSYDIYIMQEDRCVFVGSGEAAISWMKRNEGKVCPSRFPLNGL
jgi:hypothetical protein